MHLWVIPSIPFSSVPLCLGSRGNTLIVRPNQEWSNWRLLDAGVEIQALDDEFGEKGFRV